jgi:hypothetical protein
VTARQRLVQLRRELIAALVLRALFTGIAVALASTLVALLVGSSPAIALVAGIIITAVMLGRARPARSLERVALWVEERQPTLQYALVTIAGASPRDGGAVEEQALSIPWWRDARRAAARAMMPAIVAAVAASAVLAAVRASHVERGGVPSIVRHIARPKTASIDVLAHLQTVVTPPAYAHRQTVHADDPTSVDGLVGSTITISGDGDAARVSAAVDSARRTVVARDGGWTLELPMPARPALLHLRALGTGGRERLIVLAPVADAPPVVTLLLPAHDTVLRAATGIWPLRAQLRDDIGLRDAGFELVISSGEGERFTFRSATIGRVQLGNATEQTIDARLSLDSLALLPGDVLQLRAVARDGNDATGPGIGSSETRSLRIARAGEYDSVAVDPAPPGEPEAQVLSQRMLITLAEALEKRRAKLAKPVLLDESRRIAADQAKLRKRVGDIVFQRLGGEPLSEEGNTDSPAANLTPEDLMKRAEAATNANSAAAMDVEGDETPILALNKPLLEAFNAMWDAGRSLEQGEPARALPSMRIALAAIERARQAERIYLRGRPSTVVVDLAKVRLSGKEKGASSVREPRLPVDPVSRRRAERFAHAIELAARDAAAAADTLLVMRVDALTDAPQLASALDDAARALRKGDAGALSLAWLRIRRTLGPPGVSQAVGLWNGAATP